MHLVAYLFSDRRRIVIVMLFARVLSLCEMQTALIRI